MALIQIRNGPGLLNDPRWKIKLNYRNNWCKENCEGYYTHSLTSLYCFWEFSLATDAMAFKLRWS